MARRLADAVADVPDVRITQPVEANAVFAIVPPEAVPALQEVAQFYVWDDRSGEVRWMTSFDTTEQDIDTFAEAVRKVVGAPDMLR
jgi:threonine aldolase